LPWFPRSIPWLPRSSVGTPLWGLPRPGRDTRASQSAFPRWSVGTRGINQPRRNGGTASINRHEGRRARAPAEVLGTKPLALSDSYFASIQCVYSFSTISCTWVISSQATREAVATRGNLAPLRKKGVTRLTFDVLLERSIPPPSKSQTATGPPLDPSSIFRPRGRRR